MTLRARIEAKVSRAREAPAYQNYLRVRDAVFTMMDAMPVDALPSGYWEQELGGFEHLLDASPLAIERLRHHCYHITGLHDYSYRPHHAHQAKAFAEKLRMLSAEDRSGLFVSEAEALGGYGHVIKGKRVNLDTLKFYECLIALDRGGALERFRNGGKRKVVVEIGSGWGGFAYQFKTLFPDAVYVLVDLPPVFLFSATYLTTLFPEARIRFFEPADPAAVSGGAGREDFVFVPHWAFGRMRFVRPPDLLINMVSFQEMTSEQVDVYASAAAGWGVPMVYSMNRDRSRHNPELSAVSEILGRHYDLREIVVTGVSPSRVYASRLDLLRDRLKPALNRLIGWPAYKPRYEYRHLIGMRIM